VYIFFALAFNSAGDSLLIRAIKKDYASSRT
jgi:hypothetical protein